MLTKKSTLRVFSTLLIMLLMSSTASANSLAADQRSLSIPLNSLHGIGTFADLTYFYDDFESYEENSYPSSFTQIYNGCGDAAQKVVTTTGYDGADSKVFRLLGCNSWASEQYVSLPSPLPAILIIDAYVKPVSGNFPGGLRLREPSGAWGTIISEVVFNNSGNIYAGGVVIGTYTAGTWYRVTMEHDIVLNKYNVYINGIKAAENINMHPTISPTQIELLAGNSGTNEIYFDNVGSYGDLTNLFPCTQPPSGMVSWWGGDNNALDLIGGNNGTLMGNTTYASGVVDEAFSFDGVGDYVQVPDAPSLNFAPTSQLTIYMWVYPTASHPMHLIGKRGTCYDSGESANYQIWQENTIGFSFNSGGVKLMSNQQPLTNQWQHVAVTADGSIFRIYVDGQEKGSLASTLGGQNSAPLDIGGVCSGVGTTFSGLLDDVTIVSRALTADEIASIYNAGSAGHCEIDTIPPTVVSVFRADPSPTNAASVDFTVTFSENVTGVDTADFALTTTGTIVGESVSTVTGGPTVYIVTANTGGGDGTLRLDATDDDTILDSALNPLGGVGVSNGDFTTGETYDIDKTEPTVTITSLNSDPTDASPIAVTVQFSETVTGFMSDDIVTSNGAVSNFVAVDGDTYTFDLTPIAQGLVTADIAAGVATDLADNGNTAANQFSRIYVILYDLFLPMIQR